MDTNPYSSPEAPGAVQQQTVGRLTPTLIKVLIAFGILVVLIALLLKTCDAACTGFHRWKRQRRRARGNSLTARPVTRYAGTAMG